MIDQSMNLTINQEIAINLNFFDIKNKGIYVIFDCTKEELGDAKKENSFRHSKVSSLEQFCKILEHNRTKILKPPFHIPKHRN